MAQESDTLTFARLLSSDSAFDPHGDKQTDHSLGTGCEWYLKSEPFIIIINEFDILMIVSVE